MNSKMPVELTDWPEVNVSDGYKGTIDVNAREGDGAAVSLPFNFTVEKADCTAGACTVESTSFTKEPMSSVIVANSRSDADSGTLPQQLPEPSMSCVERSSPASLHFDEADSHAERRQADVLSMSSPGRTRRVPAAGRLRMPETHAPALTRLMRRPGTGSAVGDEPKTRLVLAVGDELKGRALMVVTDEPGSGATATEFQLSETAP
jgi:hypothetical protein